MTRTFSIPSVARFALLALLAACSDTTEPEIVDRLEIASGDLDLFVFDRVDVLADAYDASGAAIAGASISWASSDVSVVTIDPVTGQAEATGPGAATLTASADDARATVSVTVRVGTIDFERLADGTRSCTRCALSDEYGDWGVRFSFFTDPGIDAGPELTLLHAGARFPGDDVDNHMVTSASGPNGGTWVGVMVVTLDAPADSVELMLEGNDAVGDFPVRAYGPGDVLLPTDVIEVISSTTTTSNAGFDFRRDVFRIRSASGVVRIEMDGRNKTTGEAAGGFGLLLDDLTVWPGM